MCRLTLAASLTAAFLMGCANQSTPLSTVPTVRVTVPQELKQECQEYPKTDGSLAGYAKADLLRARLYAECRERFNALVDVVNEIERRLR